MCIPDKDTLFLICLLAIPIFYQSSYSSILPIFVFVILMLLHACIYIEYKSFVTWCSVTSAMSNLLQPTRLLCPWNFPGKNTGVGSFFLLQGIFPIQGLNPDLWVKENSLPSELPGKPFLRDNAFQTRFYHPMMFFTRINGVS